jgi:hypothetical protein
MIFLKMALFIGNILTEWGLNVAVGFSSYLIPASLINFWMLVRTDGRAALIFDDLLTVKVLVFYNLFSACKLMAAMN